MQMRFFFIQQAIHDSAFVKIAVAETAKESWTILKTAFERSSKVVVIKLQGLRREFDTLNMNQDESVQSFFTQVTTIINQIHSYGENISQKIVVMKVLCSLTTMFDHVVAAIEESKNLSTYTFDELIGSLQVHEAWLNKIEEKDYFKAFILRVSPQVANDVAEVDTSQVTTNNTLINRRKMWSVIIVIRKDMQAYCYKK
jgi:gag-polypeptide of LTR copia-type